MTSHLRFPALFVFLALTALSAQATSASLQPPPEAWATLPGGPLQASGCRFAAPAGESRTDLALSPECGGAKRRFVDLRHGAAMQATAGWVDHINIDEPGAPAQAIASAAPSVSEAGTWALMLSGVVGVLSLAHRRRPA